MTILPLGLNISVFKEFVFDDQAEGVINGEVEFMDFQGAGAGHAVA